MGDPSRGLWTGYCGRTGANPLAGVVAVPILCLTWCTTGYAPFVRIPSPDQIEAARTLKGGWTREQLAEWGVPWPPPAGWKRRLIQQWQGHREGSVEAASASTVPTDPMRPRSTQLVLSTEKTHDSADPDRGEVLAAVGDGPVVELFTDGSCVPNPGPGGWGVILRYGHHEKELYGSESATTSNRMEMMAAIRGLEHLKRPSVVHVHTDSQYLRSGITAWMSIWKINGWRTRRKEPVKNADLWMRLDEAIQPHQVEWFWVKGHAGNAENERADKLAALGAQESVAESW
jgi:ribonuclease HI